MLKVAGGLISGGGNGTVTQVDTGTGLTGGPITTSGTISLANTTVTAGTYGNSTAVAQLAIDAQGRITSASNVSISLTAGGNTTEIQYNNGGVLAGLSTFTTDGTNVVLSANSATDAFRITQLGAGNAFVVEDETNPDSTPFQINASGQVSIGTTAAAGRLNIYHPTTATVNLSGDSATAINSTRYSSDTTTTNIQMRKARGTLASPTAVNSGDGTGILIYNAYGGTNFRQIATIAAPVDTYTSDTNISGLLTFSTNSGGTAVTEKMRIDAAGTVQIGTTTSAGKLTVYDATSNTVAVQGDAATNIQIQRSSTDANNPTFAFRKTRGTVASPTAVATSDNIGAINYIVYGGTNYRTVAQIQSIVEAYVSDTDIAGYMLFRTSPPGTVSATERMRITAAGNVGVGTSTPLNKLDVTGSFGRGAPVTKTGNFTLADTENWVICNGTGSITVTFPAASSWTGREVMIKTIAAQTVVSASSNVVPRNSAVAGTAILGAAAGNWATLVSDGTNWVIMAGS